MLRAVDRNLQILNFGSTVKVDYNEQLGTSFLVRYNRGI
jgi:hypothetical protein